MAWGWWGMGWMASPAVAQAAEPAPAERMAQVLMESLARHDFALPADLPLDPALHEAAEAMTRSHLGRLRDWLLATASAVPEPRALYARYANELALWQLDAADADHERLTLELMRHPRYCQVQTGKSLWSDWLLTVQLLPEPQRQLALQAQQRRLDRWGQQRDLVLERPVPSLAERAEPLLRQLRAPVRPEALPPLTPFLAYQLLALKPQPVPVSQRCAHAAWWLAAQPAGADARELSALMRHALLWDEVHRWQRVGRGEQLRAGDGGYPAAAQRLHLEADVTVTGVVRPDRNGLEQARIVARRPFIADLPAQRWAAFETLLDQASLERAARQRLSDTAKPGQAESLELNWRLK